MTFLFLFFFFFSLVASKSILAIIATLALWVNVVVAQPTYRIVQFNSTFVIDNVPITGTTLRRLSATANTANTNVVLGSAEQAVLTKAFAGVIAHKMKLDSTLVENAVTYLSASRPDTTSVSTASISVSLKTTIDFSVSNFSRGFNVEDAFITSIKAGIDTSLADGTFSSRFASLVTSEGSTTFASATVNSAAATYSSSTTVNAAYTFTVGDFHHGDPKRTGPKVGAVSLGVVIGVIMLGLSFYIICFFTPPTTAKVEDGVVNK